MRQQCGADASGPPASYEPGSARSEALVLELSRLSRGQAQRAESLRSARLALAQRRLVATPPDGPRRVSAKIVNRNQDLTSTGVYRTRVYRLRNRGGHLPKVYRLGSVLRQGGGREVIQQLSFPFLVEMLPITTRQIIKFIEWK